MKQKLVGLAYFFLVCALAVLLGMMSARAYAAVDLMLRPDPRLEIRYCGPPERDAKGDIVRSAAVLAAFKKVHPCPSTGLTYGACPHWYMDHVVSLGCGGCDAVWNIQWLPEEMWKKKSLWERMIYGSEPPIEGTSACLRTKVQ